MGRHVPGLSRPLCLLLIWLASVGVAGGEAEEPFSVSVALVQEDEGPVLSVALSIQPKHILYADQFSVRATSGGLIAPLNIPPPVRIFDKFSEEEKEVFNSDFAARYRVSGLKGTLTVEVRYQGCSESLCFFPETRTFSSGLGQQAGAGRLDATGQVAGAGDRVSSWKEAASEFHVAAQATGYMTAGDFLSFLEASRRVEPERTTLDSGGIAARGVWTSVLLILIGGLALNLTPCVLPMIPINIAIIGAGARAGSKAKGFLLGGIYGLGIALTYGVLGLVVVLTGARFGALNASPWFNWGVAAVFAALGLALFGVFHIDFSRLQNRFGPARPAGRGTFLVALTMGSLAALLAGACVAPVVISVLVWSGDLYARGQFLGLLLPFLLGLGMGLPWPFAGAGLSFLPKPGPWMVWVERVFGVLVLGLALYYGHLGYKQLGITSL
ncbi:MAG: hypothetical protein JW820_10210, partial [Spirochaetales bacterium]|nr:hypothetical protein [Spirochaetales bacterium]